MSNIITRMAVSIAGFCIGFLVVLTALYLWPFPFENRTESALEKIAEGEGKTESFFLNITGDTVLLTHGGAFPFQPIPEGMAHVGSGQAPNTLVLVSKFRHQPDEEVLAFGTELEISHTGSRLLFGRIMTHTVWSIVVPGRGALHLYQHENNWRTIKRVIAPMLLTGKDFDGEHHGVNTFGPLPDYHGLVLGGTGEFAGATGRFVEIGTLTKASADGRIQGLMELRVKFDNR